MKVWMKKKNRWDKEKTNNMMAGNVNNYIKYKYMEYYN